MRLNIYYSGIRVAEWEDGRFLYEAGLYPVPGILKGMLPEDLSVILKEAQKAIDLGLSSFTLPGGQSYSKADEGKIPDRYLYRRGKGEGLLPASPYGDHHRSRRRL